MTLYAVENPYPVILNQVGGGLNAGKVYIGQAGMDPETNPIAVYWDAAGTIPASQPLTVIGGYIWNMGTPAQVYGPSQYSIRIRDRFDAVVFYDSNVGGPLGDFVELLASPDGAENVGYQHPGTGSVARTIYAKARERMTIADFGAQPDDGSFTGNADAFERAFAAAKQYGEKVHVPGGKIYVTRDISHSFSPTATGPSDDKNSIESLVIEGAGDDVTEIIMPNNNGFFFDCSSFQHTLKMSGLSICPGLAGGGTGLMINNRFAYFGEYNARHVLDIVMRGVDGYSATDYFDTYIDLFNASNVIFGKGMLLAGPVLGNSASTYGTGVKVASSATPGIGTSSEPGWGTGYDFTGLKTKFMGRAIQIGAGVQGFTLGDGTEILNGYDGVHIVPGVTEVRQINWSGAQMSVYGDAFSFGSAVPSCTFVGGYMGVAPGKNGLVFVTDAGAANGGGSTIVGVTFVPLGVGAGDGIYIATSFMPIVVDACTFVGLNTGVEITATGQNVTVGANNRFINCTNKVIDNGSNNRVGALVALPNGKVGYATEAGGTVTQATSKTTGVTLNKPTGSIVTNNASLAGGAAAQFTVTNSAVKATDTVVPVCQNGNYEAKICNVTNGSFDVRLKNDTGGALADAVTINFALLAGATS